MGLNDRYLCYAFYTSIPLDTPWVNPLWKLSLELAGEVGLNITHFEYDKYGNINWRNHYVYRHIKRNQNELIKIHPRLLRSLSFYCVGEDGDYLLSPFSCSMWSFGVEQTRDKMIYFQFRYDYLDKICQDLILHNHLLENINKLALPIYGFVQPIVGKKYPIFFCYGMPNSIHLNESEEADAEIWGNQWNKYTTHIRNVYWGNIITKSHWGDDFSKGRSLFSELEAACSGQITWNGDNMIFFRCPIDIFDLDCKREKFENWRKTIRRILTQYGIEILVPE